MTATEIANREFRKQGVNQSKIAKQFIETMNGVFFPEQTPEAMFWVMQSKIKSERKVKLKQKEKGNAK